MDSLAKDHVEFGDPYMIFLYPKTNFIHVPNKPPPAIIAVSGRSIVFHCLREDPQASCQFCSSDIAPFIIVCFSLQPFVLSIKNMAWEKPAFVLGAGVTILPYDISVSIKQP